MKTTSLILLVAFLFIQESNSEPDYVTNLKKYFNDGYYTGTYYRRLSSISQEVLQREAKDVFREYLRAMKYQDTERFFSEWKMTFHSDGPFKTEHDLRTLSEKMTKPDDFMTELLIADLLTNRDDANEATKAYKEAFVSKDAKRVALFYLGDDDVMHGVLAAGVRSSMDAVFVVYLMD
ncbi:hypothetical protein ACROYT_G005253 [Oculina patagonica]